MGSKYELLAAHYPFQGYYEESCLCDTLWAALKQFRKYKSQGYEIINVYYRDINNNHITWAFEEGN